MWGWFFVYSLCLLLFKFYLRYNWYITSYQFLGIQCDVIWYIAKKITIINLVNSIISHRSTFFLVMRTKIYSLSNFPIYKTVMLTIATMLCSKNISVITMACEWGHPGILWVRPGVLTPSRSPKVPQCIAQFYPTKDCCTQNASNTKLIHISRSSHLLLPSAQDIEIFSRLAVSHHLRCNLLWKAMSGPHFWNSLPHQYTWHNNSLIISLPCFLHCLAHIIMQNYLFPYYFMLFSHTGMSSPSDRNFVLHST